MGIYGWFNYYETFRSFNIRTNESCFWLVKGSDNYNYLDVAAEKQVCKGKFGAKAIDLN